MSESCREGTGAAAAATDEAARKRAAVETYARHESTLRRTARRYSLCADDADEALQRALEILLRKAPTTDPRELIRWTQTVVKHEALAVRRDRERILSGPAALPTDEGEVDWVAMIPARNAGPAERAERSEAIARSREALQTLKPQELRALSLLAEGYSYREIGEITGYSQTKINRCLAEGRERFRSLLARSEDGRRCAEMGPRLSAFCDGEASAAEEVELREHLRACPHCRVTLRSYRAAPAAAAALAPTLPALHRSLFERAHDAFAAVATRVGGGGGDSAISQVAAAGGSRGAGMAALAKALAVCAGTVGGAAACAATGVIPAPLALESGRSEPALERQGHRETEVPATTSGASYEPEVAPEPTPSPIPPAAKPEPKRDPQPVPEPEPTSTPAASSGAVEFTPPPPPPPAAEPSTSSSSSSGSSSSEAAGEFGP